jgi:hypothetical protein
MVLLGIRRPRGRMAQVTRLVVNEGKGEKRAALIRAAERWRGLRMTEFERRQLIAIRRARPRSRRTNRPRRERKRHRIPNSFIQQYSDLTHQVIAHVRNGPKIRRDLGSIRFPNSFRLPA